MKPCLWMLWGLSVCISCGKAKERVLFQNDKFTVYDNAVVQGPYRAEALSPTEIRSDYRSPVDLHYSPLLQFKFGINSRDNELPAGVEHRIVVRPENGAYTTPVLTFGEARSEDLGPLPDSLVPNARFTVRVNMNPMLQAFARQGYYLTPTGDRIYKDDFKGVYIAGGSAPLTWDFENLYSRPGMQLHDTGNGIYETTVVLNPTDTLLTTDASWKATHDLSGLPAYRSDQLLVDALYNMALDEMLFLVQPDGTLRTGAAWDGVWTRDVSYSIYLAMAYLNPDAAQKSLIAKVRNNRIVQDTGTGGAWPVSSDRVVWSIAAWEYYAYTGDRNWLRYAFDVIRNSAYDDQFTVRDPRTGLMRGEQSYLDWREQSYPRWMEPVDIYQSLCLGTNVLHAATYRILGAMAEELQLPSENYYSQERLLTEAIREYLWMPSRKQFGQYLYGNIYPLLSPGSETLGESLAILFDVATPEQAYAITANHPVTDFGSASIYPMLVNIKPYHNNAVWPFVQAYWNLAAAKADNERAVLHGLGALYRAAALFGTHKELFVASSGDFRGTAVNSDKMLWSLSGNIAMIYRLFFGMQFVPDGIAFSPYVPPVYGGTKEISGFRYRNAELTLQLKGSGNRIRSFRIDGKPTDRHFVSASLQGSHTVSIELDDRPLEAASLNVEPIRYLPETTLLSFEPDDNMIGIDNYNPGCSYNLYVDGAFSGTIGADRFAAPRNGNLTQIAVTPLYGETEGFSGRPVTRTAPGSEIRLEAEQFLRPSPLPYKGFSGSGFIETATSLNREIDLYFDLPDGGYYYADVRYANGNGPINTQNKCAIRSLYANEERAGVLVMPQRGENEWANWGYSNPVRCQLQTGRNRLSIRYTVPQDVNMNGETNSALIDCIRLRKADTGAQPYPSFRPFPLR